jgi:hypothetical protein
VLGVKLQEVGVVAFFDEDVLSIVAAIVDMIILAVSERSWFGHRVLTSYRP